MKPMTEIEVIRVARENVEAFSAGDWQRLKAALAPNVSYHEVGSQRRLQGADQMVQAYQTWKQAIPDGKGTITNAFASRNSVLIEVTWTGKQTGPLVGPSGTIPPSGKAWDVQGAQVITIEGGKILELHQYFDLLTILQQIGAAPKT
ncbi:MAG: hypothetical protein DMG13_04635 [Acidobacteria bacterium]|nr:MAG: hypothetical protein DMG13_04635 [Acidobacteriota bacterium]